MGLAFGFGRRALMTFGMLSAKSMSVPSKLLERRSYRAQRDLGE